MLSQLIKNNKTFYIDVIYSIVASGIVTAVTTFLVNPILAKQFDAASYGIVLSLSAAVTAISTVFGNTLNNVRLIENPKEDSNLHRHNYKFIISISSSMALMLTGGIGYLLFDVSIITLSLLMIFALLATYKNYYAVVFRIKINTKKNLAMSVFMSIGYGIALFVPNLQLVWPIIYVIGELISIIFIRLTTEIPHDLFKRDQRMKIIMKSYLFIISSSIIANVILYLDRFLIFPILGSEYVTLYTVSTVYAKMFTIVLTPMSTLILSYISQPHFVMTKKLHQIILISTLGLSGLFIISVPIFAPFLTNILYPQFYDITNDYFLIGAIGITIANVSLLLNPFVLRYAKPKWQFYISIIYGLTYIGLSVFLMIIWGIYGFYLAVIISSSLRTIILIMLSQASYKPIQQISIQ